MKKVKILILLLLLSGFSLHSQSNELIDRMFKSDLADFSTAALLILQSAEIIDAYGTPDDALEYLKESGWLRKEKNPQDPITLGETCLILMRAFEISGGLAWSINPTPRYAAREMQFLGAIYKRDKSPYRKISGEEVMNMISWTLDYLDLKGGSDESDE